MGNKQHISFTTRFGVVSLVSIIVILFIVWRMLPVFIYDKATSSSTNDSLSKSWVNFKNNNLHTENNDPNYYNYKSNKPNIQNQSIALFVFNPNTASKEDFEKLGLPIYTINTIMNYRNKGGKFRRKEDFKKIYNLKEEDYNRLLSYIQISAEQTNYTNSFASDHYSNQPQTPIIIQLNTTTAEELMKLKGIGPSFSNRIIKFRDALGGFISIEQVKEVYGLSDSTFQIIKNQLKVNPQLITKIKINSATETDLNKHPYIGKKLAANIILLRNSIKKFTTIEQLRQTPLINEEKYRKIAPYLTLD